SVVGQNVDGDRRVLGSSSGVIGGQRGMVGQTEKKIQPVGNDGLIVGPLQVPAIGLAAEVPDADRGADTQAGGVWGKSCFIRNDRVEIGKENPVVPFEQSGFKRHRV